MREIERGKNLIIEWQGNNCIPLKLSFHLVNSTNSSSNVISCFLLASHYLVRKLISRWHIMQWVAFPVSFNYPPCKGHLLSDHKDECFSFSCSTSGSSPNTANILARITREVKEYDVIHIWKINST